MGYFDRGAVLICADSGEIGGDRGDKGNVATDDFTGVRGTRNGTAGELESFESFLLVFSLLVAGEEVVSLIA